MVDGRFGGPQRGIGGECILTVSRQPWQPTVCYVGTVLKSMELKYAKTGGSFPPGKNSNFNDNFASHHFHLQGPGQGLDVGDRKNDIDIDST